MEHQLRFYTRNINVSFYIMYFIFLAVLYLKSYSNGCCVSIACKSSCGSHLHHIDAGGHMGGCALVLARAILW